MFKFQNITEESFNKSIFIFDGTHSQLKLLFSAAWSHVMVQYTVYINVVGLLNERKNKHQIA